MEGKKEEMESEKKRLVQVKHMMVETVEKIRKLETDFADDKIQHQKKLTNLQSIRASQDLRMMKLNNDIKNFETVLTSRRDDFKCLTRTNTEESDELNKIKSDMASSEADFVKQMEDLEREIKQGYLQLQNDKETQILLEVGLSSLKDEDQLPFLNSLIRKRRETNMNRQKELNDELARLENEETAVEAELSQKQRELVSLKEKYLDLIGAYTMNKKAKN